MRDLRLYRQKRDPEGTPEPFGDEAPPRALPPDAPRHFVVQQHAARQLHFDLRLEIEGVLVSFAVPKGPSPDPAERRLAVRTEDHPFAYADFEGVIPEGNYGAGAMIVWDRGTWRSVDGKSPAEGLAAGKLDMRMRGHKLQGRFALVRTARGEGRDWLLIAKGRRGAAEGEGELAERLPRSVYSGLTVQELAQGFTRDAELLARAEALGAQAGEVDGAALRPMLATSAEELRSREGWLYELKYDGVRLLVDKRDREVVLRARTGGDRTALYPELAAALTHLPVERAVIDGEAVVLEDDGRSSFERLQQRFTQTAPEAVERARREHPVVLFAFDLLALGDRDLRTLPLRARKELLAALLPPEGPVRFADHVEGDGEALFAAARAHGLEGVVAKRADAPYEAGRRSSRWIKVKVPRTASLLVAGSLPGRGSRARLGSLILAGHRDGELVHVGNAGSGLSDASLDALDAALEERRIDAPAFAGGPERWPEGVRFARPELVCEVRFTEVTSAGQLRHPVFLGLRDDVEPADCRAPRPPGQEPEPAAALPPAPGEALELTRLDKVFWPAEGTTKGDLLAYYEAIWPWLAPYLRDRPVVLTRYPDGIEGKSFYQKNAPDFTPAWARRESIDGTDYFVCNELRTLLYVINSGAIPLHVWSARLGSLERPDWLILDLDPKQAPFVHVVEIARALHRLLGQLGAPHVAKTSGQDGLHVMLPLGGALDHGEARALGEVLARTVVAELPEIATVTRPVAARGDKVYVDYLQNGRGKLIAAPFSVRPRPGAPVSMPLAWSQVTRRLDPTRWNLRTAPKRMASHGDPMRGLLEETTDVPALLAGLETRLRSAEEAG